MSGPALSIVVVVHNMAREAPRTLLSLSATYQRDISEGDYEVIVVDNGSSPPLDPAVVTSAGSNFCLLRIDPAPPSPARAVNAGLAWARGDVVGVMIDGARMATPGLLHAGWKGAELYPAAVAASLGWYLGRDQQRWGIEAGYDKAREDALLASIDWPSDGYRLFEIGALDEPSIDGWFGSPPESNCLFLKRELWTQLGGCDERFDAPGGGFANLDLFDRASRIEDAVLVILLGEGTFHQLHGGVATNARPGAIGDAVAGWSEQYSAIRGRAWDFSAFWKRRVYLGGMPPSFLAHLGRAILEPVGPSPLGPGFDRNLWVTSTGPRPDNPQVAALVDLAHAETRAGRFAAAAAVSRIARALAPDEPAPQLILPIVGPWLRGRGDAPAGQEANFHRARGDAYRILGDAEAAASEYRAALTYDPDLVQAYIGLSELRLPGEPYVAWLDRLHQLLQPRVYLEIGVEKGRTLGLARPPTRAVGVDPQPDVSVPFRTETHVYAETSDAFFVRSDLHSILGGPVDFAFIDGMHVFQQALRDFINIEALCHRGAVIALHDTYPLDEITQRPERHCRFYSGDVWKTVACLRELRPDLQIQTIATPWTGLTIITGLDPQSRVLSEGYDAAVARVADYRYEAMEGELPQIVGLTPNDWDAFASGFARRAELRAPAAQAPAGA